ncbi:GRB2-associated-binding protein 1-like isoform X2 [Scleropages formosus]|uniref:GRB2-associated-binding protein 1-like isoform X2 n=1 Tax=Scleropages formosus TaxID=113540 RepID=UPI0010FAAD4C|nr:GRB2-associated-binding protein 1-like isoform X2 [Scleropages formosus]
MSGGDVVCSGWLIKSPPEKKLKRYAWKKRWFVLRSGRLTGDPDVLEYYKNDHAKKPIRVIDLNLCEQVDAGLTFNKKELEHSFIFDIKTIDRVFYLVADTEDEMNKWVRCICDICGFNPTDEALGDAEPSPMSGVPPPYHPVSVRHLESSSSQEEAPDYLLLINCESKKPGSSRLHTGSCRSMSAETDFNDNLPSHRLVSSAPKHSSPNGFFPQRSTYESPPPRSADAATAAVSLLPRSFSQDTVLQPRAASSPRKASVESQMRHFSISYDVPPTPGSGGVGGIAYQVPRTGGGSESDVPPPRPPKPSVAAPPERSPTDSYHIPRSVSESDGNYIAPTGAAGGKGLRSNTVGTVELSVLRKDFGSQECYDVPRPFGADRSNSFELNESFNNYLKNKGMVPVGGGSTEDMDTNYVPMGGNSPSHHRSGSLADAPQEPSYVPMTPGGSDFPSLGKQVPPPVHMGFRCSPKTPPRRPVAISDCQPPPVDRNLKPDRKGQSPKILRALERTDSQTVGGFQKRQKGRPPKLDIKPMQEWEELPAPVHSPVTRSFARDFSRFPMPPRPPSAHSITSSTDSEDCDENYVPMTNSSMIADEPTLKLSTHMNTDGGSGSSPMVKPKREKQVEYLDLDLDPGKSTPPRKKKSNGTGGSISDERVDYVVVDQQRTQALKNTKEAWNDGRQSTETDVPPKGPK